MLFLWRDGRNETPPTDGNPLLAQLDVAKNRHGRDRRNTVFFLDEDKHVQRNSIIARAKSRSSPIHGGLGSLP